MKLNIKKFISGTIIVATLTTMISASAIASEEVITDDAQDKKPPHFQMHNRRPKGFEFKGKMGHGRIAKGEFGKMMPTPKKELTQEEKQTIKEKFGERKELTEEEKQAIKEKLDERRGRSEKMPYPKKELTQEEIQAMKEKFGERKELTEEEKQTAKEFWEEKMAEMKAKMEEKEVERKAKFNEKLANGELTQEQYDKMIEQKSMPLYPDKGMGRGRGMGPDRCAQCGCHKTTETPKVTEE